MSSKCPRSDDDEAEEGPKRKAMKVEKLSDGQERLLYFLNMDEMPMFKLTLDSGVDPNCRDDMGLTPLHYFATDENPSALLVKLLQHGADPNATDAWGKTALHHAVEGCVDNVRSLLDAGAHIDAQDNEGTTPLMTAALRGKQYDVQNVVQLLADRGCNVHLRSKEGSTALHMLCTNTMLTMDVRCSIARMLLGMGLSATAENKEGQQAFCMEVSRVKEIGQSWLPVDLPLMKVLIQAGSNINLEKNHPQNMVMSCLRSMNTNFNWQMLQMIAPVLPLAKLQCFQGLFSEAAKTLERMEDFVGYVDQRSRIPLSLQACCRLALRERFQGKVFYHMQTASVSESAKKYVCDLEDDFEYQY